PVELIGGVRFPAIGELPYLLTLAGHGFYWFRLSEDSVQGRAAGGSAGWDLTP
ncbi:alpha-glucosidase C-terminal domain-containing protein, partial [Streptomyces sp. NPDC052225]|uniref:alpha-glucosidase C-terminal domain-containing protein n=1 Tax=Streptomyces sp. NPDC052225 TaxID=3154949 RepID=UPI003414287E